MADKYQIDLQQYSLQKFKQNLITRELIPSRALLKEDIEARFKVIAGRGITTLQELIENLRTKAKIETFAQKTGLAAEYLTILNREARSYLSKPIRLDKFLGVEMEYIEELAAQGIKNSRHLFREGQSQANRRQLGRQTGIPVEIINELVGMSDLVRIYGVGPVFARMIYDVGVKSVREFVKLHAADFVEIYEAKTNKKADFGVGEIEFSLHLARELELAVEL